LYYFLETYYFMAKRIAIAGAGISGAVLARCLSEAGWEVDVFDARNHIAGNCHTERDDASGVLVHRYGPHIFHTSDEEVWAFVNRYGTFNSFRHRVKAVAGGRVFGLPINLLTINQFFGRNMSPDEAKVFISKLGEGGSSEPANFEEQAMRFVGRDLYEAFFKGYSKKQWGVDPVHLPASVLKRLPVRFDYNDEYFNHKYQAMPVSGYTALVEKMLDAPGIQVHLGRRISRAEVNDYDHFFYTGPLDGYFDYALGRLGYRTLDFDTFRFTGDFQGCAVINYCDADVPFTRITEHKHFSPWESHAESICYREHSRLAGPDDTPYYPIRLAVEQALLGQYLELARRESRVTFVGRLATYRYLDMDVSIGEALRCARKFLECRQLNAPMPPFTVDPESHA